jgi:hypothetical protein
MSSKYPEHDRNVEALCARIGIEYPPREKDCKINTLSITEGLSGEKRTVFEDGLNFIGLLYFQEKFSGPGWGAYQIGINPQFKRDIAQFFAEKWEDEDCDDAQLISMLQPTYSVSVEIWWKTTSTWIEEWNA